MKVSFNGLRRNIASAFNKLVRSHDATDMEVLRMHIANLLAVYDDDIDGDFDDLSDSVELDEVIG